MKAKREHQLFQQHRKAAVEARKEIKTVGLLAAAAAESASFLGRSAGVSPDSHPAWGVPGRSHSSLAAQAARQKREGAKSRKEENRKKSAVTQTITSRATLRKMMKSRKGRKQLQVADTVVPS